MNGALPVDGPRMSIELPAGTPAFGGALEWVLAAATPEEQFVEADVTIDGVKVAHRTRRLPEQAVISAWCDARGLPPGLHEIVVDGRWASGDRARARRLLVVALGQPVEWWPVSNGGPADVAMTAVSDPELETHLARTALGGAPLVVVADGAVPGPGALERIAATFAADASVDLVIGDDAAMIGETRWQRWRKHAFEPEAITSIDHVGPLLAVGPRAADVLCDALPAEAGVYGLALELLDRGLQAVALPHVLALTPEVRLPTDDAATRQAVRRLAARRGRPVTIDAGRVEGLREVRWPLVEPPPVVAVIPSRTPRLAETCLAGLAESTDYPALRTVVVDSSDDEGAMRRVIDAAAVAVERVRYPAGEPFNYQRAVNLGAAGAGDGPVLFLNDDVRPLRADWLTRMVELVTLPGVGIVGALLRHPDGSIQHAGVDIGQGTGHRYHDAPADARGHRFELLVPGNPQAVTGACMLVRGELLDELGGHDELYAHVYGDVDLCFRATERGWRVAWCPAELEHLESASYGSALDSRDIALFTERWHRDRRPPAARIRI